ncbi:MAG: type II toxin-antitoxin system Phd/YefM family antitoxin [Thermoanaerobaculia bacterium]
MSKTVAAAEFQAHSLELLEEVAAKQEESLIVMKDGKTLAKVVPVQERPRKSLEQMRAEGVKILGDIIEPIAEWDMTR